MPTTFFSVCVLQAAYTRLLKAEVKTSPEKKESMYDLLTINRL